MMKQILVHARASDTPPRSNARRWSIPGTLFILVLVLFPGCTSHPEILGPIPCSESSIPNTLEQVLDDMTMPNEGHPHGVPSSYDWYDQATYEDLEQLDPSVLAAYHAVIPWGQVYENDREAPTNHVFVQVRALQGWVRMRSSTLPDGKAQSWILAEPGIVDLPDSGLFPEDMGGGPALPSNAFSVPVEKGGGIAGVPGGGHAFHFFSPSRYVVDASDIEAVFTTFEARLVLDDPSYRDTCKEARYLASSGMDAYTSSVDDVDIAPSIAQGRMRYVTGDWSWFNAWYVPSMDPAYLVAAPPPMNRRSF